MMPYPIPYYPVGYYSTQALDDAGKIFVGGIPADATKETLTEYFNQFGEVSDCIIMLDNITGRSRGFGFVTFLDPNSVRQVLSSPNKHCINGKVVDAKKAVPKGPNQSSILKAMGVTSNRADRNPECKVFVGGVAQGTTETDLAQYFAEFGKVLEVKIPKDQNTQRARGFSFVLFENRKSVEKATRERYHVINNKTVEVKTVHLSTPSSVSDRESDDGNVQTPPSPFQTLQQRPGYYSYQGYPYGMGASPSTYYDPSAYEASQSGSTSSLASTGSAGVGSMSASQLPTPRIDEYQYMPLYQGFSELSISPQQYQGRGYPGTISRAQFPVPTSDFPPTAYSPTPVPTSGTPMAFQPTPAPIIPHGTSPSVYATITGQHPGSTVPPAHIPVPVTNPQTGMQATVTSLKR